MKCSLLNCKESEREKESGRERETLCEIIAPENVKSIFTRCASMSRRNNKQGDKMATWQLLIKIGGILRQVITRWLRIRKLQPFEKRKETE